MKDSSSMIDWNTQRFVDAARNDQERAAAHAALEADRRDVVEAVITVVVEKLGISWPKHEPLQLWPFTEAELHDCAARACAAYKEVLQAIAGGQMPPAKHRRIVEALQAQWSEVTAPEPILPPALADNSSTGPSTTDHAVARERGGDAWSIYHDRRRAELEAEHRRVYAHLWRAHDEWVARRQAREAALRREGLL